MDWHVRKITDGYIKSVYRKPKNKEQAEFDTENSGASGTNGDSTSGI